MKRYGVCFLWVLAFICIFSMKAKASTLHVAMMDEEYLKQAEDKYAQRIEKEKEEQAKAVVAKMAAKTSPKKSGKDAAVKNDTGKSTGYKTSAGSYSAQEIEILYKICHAESRGEGQRGQMAVANVILNRVKSSKFPNSIREVVYQKGQFTPAASGSFSSIVPSEEVKQSVQKVLGGERVFSDSVLYFKSTSSSAKWGKLKLATQIGRHMFYEG